MCERVDEGSTLSLWQGRPRRRRLNVLIVALGRTVRGRKIALQKLADASVLENGFVLCGEVETVLGAG